MGEIFIRYIDMDVSAMAFTVTDANGDYNIYVNTAYSLRQQQKAIRHEMRHINMNHFYLHTDVLQDEADAENKKYIPCSNDNTNIVSTSASTPLEKLRLDCRISADRAANLRGISRRDYFLYEKGLAKCPPRTEHKIISVLINYKNG